MIQVIKCPACAAPLECDENLFERCNFCGSKIVVNRNNVVTENSFGFDKLLGQAHKLKEILNLVRSGNKIGAIKLYRETFGVSLRDAKDAVDELEARQNVNFQNVQFQTYEPVNIDGKAIAKTAKVVGIVSLIPVLIGLLAAFIGVGVAIYAVYKATEKPTVSNFNSPNAPKSGENSIANEILRFGGEGVGAGNFKDNRSVTVDAEGRIYSTDYQGGRIQVFDKEGKFLTQWFIENKGSPIIALAASRNSKLYVAQSNKIMAFEGVSGKLLNETKVRLASDIAITLTGNIILLERTKISIFDEKLAKLTEYPDINKTAGISDYFGYIAVNGLGEIYTIPRNGQDICKFSAEGKFIDRFKVKPVSVNGIAVDAKGRIFISETSNIWVYQANGELMDSFKTKQTFGLVFNDQNEFITASRPFIVKYAVNF